MDRFQAALNERLNDRDNIDFSDVNVPEDLSPTAKQNTLIARAARDAVLEMSTDRQQQNNNNNNSSNDNNRMNGGMASSTSTNPNNALYLSALFSNNEFVAKREELARKNAEVAMSNALPSGLMMGENENSSSMMMTNGAKSRREQQQQRQLDSLQEQFSPQKRRQLLQKAEQIVTDSVDPLFKKIAEKTKGHRENNAICVIVSASSFSRSVLSLHMERRGWTCVCVSKTEPSLKAKPQQENDDNDNDSKKNNNSPSGDRKFANTNTLNVSGQESNSNYSNKNDDDSHSNNDKESKSPSSEQNETEVVDLIESIKEVHRRFRYGQQSVRFGGKAKLGKGFDVRFSEEGGTTANSSNQQEISNASLKNSSVPKIRLVLIDSFTHELPQDSARNVRTIANDDSIVVVQLTQIRSDGGRGLQLPNYVEPDPAALEALIASGAAGVGGGGSSMSIRKGHSGNNKTSPTRTRASSLTKNSRRLQGNRPATVITPREKVDVIVRSAFTSTLAEKISTFFLTEAARSRSRIVNVTSVYDSIRGILGGVSSRRFDSGDGIIGEMYDCFSPSSDLVQEMFRLKKKAEERRGSMAGRKGSIAAASAAASASFSPLSSPKKNSSIASSEIKNMMSNSSFGNNNNNPSLAAFSAFSGTTTNNSNNNIDQQGTNPTTTNTNDPSSFLSFESDPRFVVLRAHYQHMRKLLENANEEIKGKERRIRKMQDEVGTLTEEVKNLSSSQEGLGVAALLSIPKETEDVGCSTADDDELGQTSWLQERNRLLDKVTRSEAKVKRLQENISTSANTHSHAATAGETAALKYKIQELEEKIQDSETERNLLKEVANTAQKQWFEMAGSASARMESSLRGSVVFASAEAQRQSGRGALVIGGAAFSNVNTLVDQMKQQANKIKHANAWKKGLREMLRVAESSAMAALDVDANITRSGRRPTLVTKKGKLREYNAFSMKEDQNDSDENNNNGEDENHDSDENDDDGGEQHSNNNNRKKGSNKKHGSSNKRKRDVVLIDGEDEEQQCDDEDDDDSEDSQPFASSVPKDALRKHKRNLVRVTGTKKQQQQQPTVPSTSTSTAQTQQQASKNNNQAGKDGDYLLQTDLLKESSFIPAGADRSLLEDTSYHYPRSSSDDDESGFFGDNAKAREKKKQEEEAEQMTESTFITDSQQRSRRKKNAYSRRKTNKFGASTMSQRKSFTASSSKKPSSSSHRHHHNADSLSDDDDDHHHHNHRNNNNKHKRPWTMHESYQKLKSLSKHLDGMFEKVVDYTERAAEARRAGLDGLFDAVVRIAEKSTKQNDASKIVKLRAMVDEKQRQLDAVLSRPLGADQGSMNALRKRGDEFFKHYVERYHLVAELRRLEENCSVQHASRVKEHILRNLLTAQNRIDEVGSYLLNNNELFMYAESRMEVHKLLQELAPWISSDEYELLEREGKSAISEMITKCQIARTTVEDEQNNSNLKTNSSSAMFEQSQNAARGSLANPASNNTNTGRRRMSVSIAHFERTARALLGNDGDNNNDDLNNIPTRELAADLDREISRFVLDEGVTAIRDILKQLRGMWERDAADCVANANDFGSPTSSPNNIITLGSPLNSVPQSPANNKNTISNRNAMNFDSSSPIVHALFGGSPPSSPLLLSPNTTNNNKNSDQIRNLHYIVNSWKNDVHQMVMMTADEVGRSIEDFCKKEKEAQEFIAATGFDIRPFNRTIAEKMLHDPFSAETTNTGDNNNTNHGATLSQSVMNQNNNNTSMVTMMRSNNGKQPQQHPPSSSRSLVDPSATNIRIVSICEAFRDASLLLHTQLRRLLLQLKRRTPLTKVKIVDFAVEHLLNRKKRIRQTGEFPGLMCVDAELVSKFADYFEDETKGQYLLARASFKAKAGEMMKNIQTQTTALHAIQEQARSNLRDQQRRRSRFGLGNSSTGREENSNNQEERADASPAANNPAASLSPPPMISITSPSAGGGGGGGDAGSFNNTLKSLNASGPGEIDLYSSYKSTTIANTNSVLTNRGGSSASNNNSGSPLSNGSLSMNPNSPGHFAKIQSDGTISVQYLQNFGKALKGSNNSENSATSKNNNNSSGRKRSPRSTSSSRSRGLLLEYEREGEDADHDLQKNNAADQETMKNEEKQKRHVSTTIAIQVSEVQDINANQSDEEDEEDFEEEEEESEDDEQTNGSKKQKKSVKLPPLLTPKNTIASSSSLINEDEIEAKRHLSYFGVTTKKTTEQEEKEKLEKEKALASFTKLPQITKIGQQLFVETDEDKKIRKQKEQRENENAPDKSQRVITVDDLRLSKKQFQQKQQQKSQQQQQIPSPPPHQQPPGSPATTARNSQYQQKQTSSFSAPSSSQTARTPSTTNNSNNKNQQSYYLPSMSTEKPPLVDEGRIPGRSELPWAKRVAVQEEHQRDRSANNITGNKTNSGKKELAPTSETTFGESTVNPQSGTQNQSSNFKPLKLVSSRPMALAPTMRTSDGKHTLVGGGSLSSSQRGNNYNLVVVDDD